MSNKNGKHRPQSREADALPTPKNSVDLGVLNDGNVIINFAELVQHMTFTPEMARKIGQGFIEMATKADILKAQLGKRG